MSNQPARLHKKEEYEEEWFLIKPSHFMILLIIIMVLIFIGIIWNGSCTEANNYYYHIQNI